MQGCRDAGKGCRDGWVDGWMDGWMDAWMHGCMAGGMDGWTDGWIYICICIYTCMHPCMHACIRTYTHLSCGRALVFAILVNVKLMYRTMHTCAREAGAVTRSLPTRATWDACLQPSTPLWVLLGCRDLGFRFGPYDPMTFGFNSVATKAIRPTRAKSFGLWRDPCSSTTGSPRTL